MLTQSQPIFLGSNAHRPPSQHQPPAHPLACLQVWSTKQPGAVTSIDVKANVCCVKYNPVVSHEVVVGSADHNVHLYDLRKPTTPMHTFKGALAVNVYGTS